MSSHAIFLSIPQTNTMISLILVGSFVIGLFVQNEKKVSGRIRNGIIIMIGGVFLILALNIASCGKIL
jgi:hypothetical protein